MVIGLLRVVKFDKHVKNYISLHHVWEFLFPRFAASSIVLPQARISFHANCLRFPRCKFPGLLKQKSKIRFTLHFSVTGNTVHSRGKSKIFDVCNYLYICGTNIICWFCVTKDLL